jgi:hypothetical protein
MWKSVESSQIGQGYQDSWVHLYGRECGFKGEEDQVQNDGRALKVLQEMQSVTCFPKSRKQYVQMFEAFECFVLKAHPNLPYAEFLKTIAHRTRAGPRVKFQVPP